MANEHPTYAWYRAPIAHRFTLYRRLIGSLAEHIRSEMEETLVAWSETAESIAEPDIQQEVLAHLVGEGVDFEILEQITFGALFASSVSLFEFELLRICHAARRYSRDPEPTIDDHRFELGKAKDFLQGLGVSVPVHKKEWHDVRRFVRIRNVLVHGGGFLTPPGDDADFARYKGIFPEPIGNPRPNRPVKIQLSKSFCEDALNTFERLLLGMSDAWVAALVVRNG